MRTGTKDGLRFFSRMVVGLALLFSLTACTGDRKSEIIFTTGFFRNEIFRIGSMSCTTKELNVYLLNAENKYRKTLGESVFNEDVVAVIKDDCLSELSQLMAMDLFAQSKGIVLEASDQAKVGQAAKEYFHSLSDADQEALNHITEGEIASLYQERALAQKVYLYTIRNINPEISDDEARTVTLRQICIYKKTADAFDKISKAKEELEEGGDFATVSSHYNEADSDRISVSRGDKNKALEEAAFSLDTGKIIIFYNAYPPSIGNKHRRTRRRLWREEEEKHLAGSMIPLSKSCRYRGMKDSGNPSFFRREEKARHLPLQKCLIRIFPWMFRQRKKQGKQSLKV